MGKWEERKQWMSVVRRLLLVILAALCCRLLVVSLSASQGDAAKEDAAADSGEAVETTANGDYIKWVEFNVTCEAMAAAYELDTSTYKDEVHLDWIELLAYVGAKHGGKFDKNSVREIQTVAGQLKNKETTLKKLTKDMEYYDYYLEAYHAVLDGMVGEFSLAQAPSGTDIKADSAGEAAETDSVDEAAGTDSADDDRQWKRYYGLKAFSPVAKGFDYSHYDDFGSSRSYGYARPHLGHDMMGQIGTPIIAIESGYVEALGWNQYGGWRIGIRSFDGKRYYYYAHLRQNYPYAEGLEEGSVVTAGDVIGYMGHTGYSTTENVNNIKTVHLHWGLQLIFDESQKEGNNEIWIDCYELTKFLYRNRSEVAKIEGTKEWKRVYDMIDPAVENHCKNDTAMIQ